MKKMHYDCGGFRLKAHAYCGQYFRSRFWAKTAETQGVTCEKCLVRLGLIGAQRRRPTRKYPSSVCCASSLACVDNVPLESAADAVIEVWDGDSTKDNVSWFSELESRIESLRAARKGDGR